jgi:hypothetical protein
VTNGLNVAGVVQKTVADGHLPALVVIHDDEDDWVINDGVNDPNIPDACDICHLSHLVALDPTIVEVMNIPAGYVAFRHDRSSPWVIQPWQYPDDELVNVVAACASPDRRSRHGSWAR